ncbi:NAD(P)-binding protein [Hypoxylon trugodes]|uniref:NAD(P)-binding protein n=1 Tax=Hypoxylon trugodes TaxID=326681 RepID=UPI00219D82D1|nr:NAD(P)-binding protein [Hypoxylon trugodes]KAI1389585.1 NAD(P)-binding protein [Hypoxylon trugodes]
MTQKTVAFFGASFGVGLSALKHSLAAGHQCVALCRNPTRLTSVVPKEENTNLQVVQGNAHDVEAVSRCIKTSDGKFVDEIIFTIGTRFIMSKMSFEDVNVCEKGMTTLFEALANLRSQGVEGRPHIVAVSTTGLSKFTHDMPRMINPVWQAMIKVPGADKRVMEDKLAESGEEFTIVRASFLVDGESDRTIREGIEDPTTGVETPIVGYKISREDAGRWIARNLVMTRNEKYINKTASITY